MGGGEATELIHQSAVSNLGPFQALKQPAGQNPHQTTETVWQAGRTNGSHHPCDQCKVNPSALMTT